MHTHQVLFSQGFRRIYDDMTEIVLDIPNGYLFLTKLVEKGHLYGFIQQHVVDELPQRFVITPTL